MSHNSPDREELRPHPLAVSLIERLKSASGARILEIGAGSGRNRKALLAAGFAVDSFAEPPEIDELFDAAITTHALLHGTRESVAEAVERIGLALHHGAPFYATFASVRDARYGEGKMIAAHAYAAETGEEAGVAHAYFDEPALRKIVERSFDVESLEERPVDAIVGRWAHSGTPRGRVHFFLVAHKRRIDL
ncbi:MAG TPA: hypothetical protein VGZ02_14505 [Candidatus Baltobacteraceae bacterium]|jgi:hypothetical protein|nr:hypothetical protein [Candidatus Baltobacteraceae bacterium]